MKHFPRKAMCDDDRYSDVHMTPTSVAHRVVNHFNPSGRVLEPAYGGKTGGYWNHKVFTDLCEIREGKDFFDFTEKVDWIFTNPPYSIIVQFLEHSLEVADNVVFAPVKLSQLLSSKKRNRMIKEAGFQIKELIIMDTPPKPFPQTGFQYFAMYFKRGYTGDVKWTDWRK
jgi:hypothetical protein